VIVRIDPADRVTVRAAGATEERPCSVLLVRRVNPPSAGEWSLPGGVLELGETLEAGIVREVREETGMRVEPIAVVEVLDLIKRDRSEAARVQFHYVLIDFLCRVGEGSAPATAGSDASETLWLPRRDIEGPNGFALPERTVQVVRKALRMVDAGAEI
jgi:ADP-ribose pyrophosphatase YjhB (NUDIX family)